jgi:hypothetical protein
LPANYDILKAYGKTVYLSDETTIKRTCSVGSDKFGNGSQVKNEFGKDIVRKFVVNNNIREREANKLSVDVARAENVSLFEKEPKMGELANLEANDCDLAVRTDPDPTRSMPNQGNSSEEQTGIGPHPRKDELTPAKTICAKCGQDLTGKGTVEKNGKLYCAVVGCGFSARGEMKA